MRELHELDGTDSDQLCQGFPLPFILHPRTPFRALPRNLDGIVQQVAQQRQVPRPRLEWLAVLTKDRPEGDMLQLNLPSAARRHRKKLLEMITLPVIHDIPGTIGLQLLHPVIDGGDIGGGVVEAPVALADDHGFVLPSAFLLDPEGILPRID